MKLSEKWAWQKLKWFKYRAGVSKHQRTIKGDFVWELRVGRWVDRVRWQTR